VFGLGIRKGRRIKNSVGISLVDLSLPVRGEEANKIDPKYLMMLKNNIEKFIDEGKEVYLFSFCEHEGDLRTIDRILELMGDYYQARVNIVDYTGKSGDLYYFVKLYSRMEKTICTRFHSLVMSLVFKQELMVVSYSDKLNNLLDDLGYDFDVVNIDSKIDKIVINDSDFKVIDDKTLKMFKREALRHFESLDKNLKLRKKTKSLKIKKNTLRSSIYDKLTKK
jgi:colanic acid/amylovoran biosynthesis protein